MVEEELLPPTAGDGRQRLVKHGAPNSSAGRCSRWCRPHQYVLQLCQWLGNSTNSSWDTFCGLNHAIHQRLDLQKSCCPSRQPAGARELCDAPHTLVRQWSDMLQQPAKQQLKTSAGIRPPGRLLAIVEIEEA